MAIDGRELAASAIAQSDAAEDVKKLRSELARIHNALEAAEARLAIATAHRHRLLDEVAHG